MIRTIYRVLCQSAYLVVFPFLRYKARSSKKWRERLGYGFASRKELGDGSKHLWAHAASVGEVKALAVALEALLAEFPDIDVTLSVMTDKGLQTAERIITERLDPKRITARFLPLDTPRAINRALNSTTPSLFLFTETEIWPNWLAELRKCHIQHVLINARISESSFGSYMRIRKTMSEALGGYSQILCQSDTDRERYSKLGAIEEALSVCGNLKNDIAPKLLSHEERKLVREALGVSDDEFLFVCGSVRPGEEGMALDLFLALSPAHPRLKIALAPRHDNMITETEGAARQRMLILARYTHEPNPAAKVIVVDKFGVLGELYGASDLSFVGGTLVDIGGHNVLEPSQAGAVTLFGPSLNNVTREAAWLVKNNFGFQINDWTEFVTTVQGALEGKLNTRVTPEAYLSARSSDSPTQHTMNKLRPLLNSLES